MPQAATPKTPVELLKQRVARLEANQRELEARIMSLSVPVAKNSDAARV
jgi:hypothetical protein